MIVCIPLEFRPEGGGQYFLEHFRSYLRSRGHQVVSRVSERHDVLFTNHWTASVRDILRAIRYVEDNPRKEGKRRQRWKFVTPVEAVRRIFDPPLNEVEHA